MLTKDFYLDFNVTGSERKRLVQAISAYTGADSKYLGAPTFSYEVDYFTIDKNGVVSFDDRADSEEIEGLLETLANEGFVSQVSNLGCEDDPVEIDIVPSDEIDGVAFAVEMPRDGFTDEDLEKLRKLVDSKAGLIQKAFGAAALPIEVDDEMVAFPWFPDILPDAVKAYTHFITAICEMAKSQKRITAKERAVDNEKYAFRCFLLRLGFIGKEYKAERKILLKNFTGSSAFREVKANEISE